jgi:hypothetical protein
VRTSGASSMPDKWPDFLDLISEFYTENNQAASTAYNRVQSSVK